MSYDSCTFKIPQEADDYRACSRFVTGSIEAIIEDAIGTGRGEIVINTNLKRGLPMENINKVAGPFVEAWAVETFQDVIEDKENSYHLINVQAVERLHMADMILQFSKKRKPGSAVTAEVDVKATAEDIEASGKSPNITSFARIRTAYIEDPDYIFVILSLKHRVHSVRNEDTQMMDGIMEVVSCNAYDLKLLSSKDLNYNPALGTGQIQVRDIHYVDMEARTAWEFCQLLDQMYLRSGKRNYEQWLELAKKHEWIKADD